MYGLTASPSFLTHTDEGRPWSLATSNRLFGGLLVYVSFLAIFGDLESDLSDRD